MVRAFHPADLRRGVGYVNRAELARMRELLALPCADGYEGIVLDCVDEVFWYFSARLEKHDPDNPEESPHIVASDPQRARVRIERIEAERLMFAQRVQHYFCSIAIPWSVEKPRRFVTMVAT